MAPRKKLTRQASPPPITIPSPTAAGAPSSSLSSLESPLASTSATRSAPPSPPRNKFAFFRTTFREALEGVVTGLIERRRTATELMPEEEMDRIVEGVLDKVGRGEGEPGWRKDTWKTLVDRGLEGMLLDVALHPQDQSKPQYGLLCDVLDVILTFSDKGHADATLPLSSIQSLVEMQTISGCHQIFTYIETRVDRLTKDMHPTRGKGPLLLRLLNELLRRLPKSKADDVIFSGRILMFLSSVFPLGEKSGVNLRGNFNTGKGTVFEDKEEVVEQTKGEGEAAEDKMEDVKLTDAPEPEDFYTTFWSLQRSFNNPPSLFSSTATPSATPATPASARPDGFLALKHGLEKTLEDFATATKKEKDVLGHKEGEHKAGSTKAKKDDSPDEVLEHYFFPKFLTSRSLLELEIADPAFRRQILIQMLILFQYLLGSTFEQRKKSLEVTTNPSALLKHIVTDENEKWIIELRAKTLAEMQSMSDGPRFRQTVELILKREQNWINWKLTSCPPISKTPLPESVSGVARQKLKGLTRKPKAFPYPLGNPVLSRLWEKDAKTLADLQTPVPEKSFNGLVKEWKIIMRSMEQKQAERKALVESDAKSADVPATLRGLDHALENFDVKAKTLHWRAIREAAVTHINLFSAVESGGLDGLVKAIEAEELKVAARAAAGPVGTDEVSVTEVEEEAEQSKEELKVEPKEEGGKSPITPKRPRGEDDDVEMVEGESEAKKLKQEA